MVQACKSTKPLTIVSERNVGMVSKDIFFSGWLQVCSFAMWMCLNFLKIINKLLINRYPDSQKHESTNFWEPTVHVREKTLIEVGSSHLYASFGTSSCVQISPFLEAHWVLKKCLKTVKSLFSKENDGDFKFFRKFRMSLCLE